jgi:hypothetical protein
MLVMLRVLRMLRCRGHAFKHGTGAMTAQDGEATAS